ncbi:MAG TPA: hypothetical protein VM597_28410 [Gemmataceae bacterium]|jgi:hypothetical protein|nr:hypothetical protein [Gemmataceae bacterium]
MAYEAWGRGWRDEDLVPIAGLVVLAPLLGFGLYDGLRRAGWRVSRPPEQGEDYGDRSPVNTSAG